MNKEKIQQVCKKHSVQVKIESIGKSKFRIFLVKGSFQNFNYVTFNGFWEEMKSLQVFSRMIEIQF